MDLSATCDSIAAAAATVAAVATALGWPERAKQLDEDTIAQAVSTMLAAKRQIARLITVIESAIAADQANKEI